MNKLADKIEKASTEPAKAEQPAKVATSKVVKAAPADAVPKALAFTLAHKRAHNSPGDMEYREVLKSTLRSMGLDPYLVEENIIVRLGKNSKTLFSCHVDTVHATSECAAGVRQALAYDSAKGHLFLAKESAVNGNCLGADDGAGIYVLLELLAAKVEGLYVFHVGEERGGIGSRALAAVKHRDLFKGIQRAVAFDRKGTEDLIITQGGKACASIEAGQALADALNKADTSFKYVNSHNGSFTDTKVYSDFVPECYNVSCGYYEAHTAQEYLDVPFLVRLAKACCAVKWDSLVVKRDPLAQPAYSGYGGSAGYGRNSGSGRHFGFEDEDLDNYGGCGGKPKPRSQVTPFPTQKQLPMEPVDLFEEMDSWSQADFVDFVQGDPDRAAAAMMRLYVQLEAERMKSDLYEQMCLKV